MNIIGKIVVAGNVRRTAEIAFGEPEDNAFMEMKNWETAGVETGSIAPPELEAESPEDFKAYNEFKDRDVIAKKYADKPWSYKFGGWSKESDKGVKYTSVGITQSEKKEESTSESYFPTHEENDDYPF